MKKKTEILIETTVRRINISEIKAEIEKNANPRERPVWRKMLNECRRKGTWRFFNRKPKSDLERQIRQRFKLIMEICEEPVRKVTNEWREE